MRTSLKARYVFPVAEEPISDGVVTIEGEHILAVGREPGGDHVLDLGNAAVLPGFVNAHAHLEYSDLDAPLGKPGIPFVDWIRQVVAYRAELEDHDESEAIRHGYQQSLAGGTTTLGEIVQLGWSDDLLPPEGPDTTAFLELIAPTTGRIAPTVGAARTHLQNHAGQESWRPGLSPHAPYSVHSEVLGEAIQLAAGVSAPVAMHLAESREELELLAKGDGPFRNFLEAMGAWQEGFLAPGTRPLDYLQRLAMAPRTLVIHGNYLDDEEIAFLADRAGRMAVVYCPRTHAYFGHDAYPLEKMLAAGATVALGTDSRASCPDLSMLSVMRAVAQKHPEVDRSCLLALATSEGARALGRGHEVGTLEPRRRADLVVVPLPDRDVADPHALLFESAEGVLATWCRGRRTETA